MRALDLPVHGELERLLGYPGLRDRVVFWWDPVTRTVRWWDGIDAGPGNNNLWRLWLAHPRVAGALEGVASLGLDRAGRGLVAPATSGELLEWLRGQPVDVDGGQVVIPAADAAARVVDFLRWLEADLQGWLAERGQGQATGAEGTEVVRGGGAGEGDGAGNISKGGSKSN